MTDSQVKTANICNITSSTTLWPNADGSGTYIADNSISVHMTNHRASGIYVNSLPEQGVIGDKYTISFVPVCATNNVMLVVLHGVTTQISFTSGNRYTLTITATATDKIVAFYGGDTVEKTVIIKDIQIEKGETATPYRPYSATGWLHSLRKLTTATDIITTLPADLYADGTNATVGLKGNMSQTGTPTPNHPLTVNGVGVRTENWFDGTLLVGFYLDINTMYADNPNYRSFRIQGLPAGQYTVSWNIPVRLVRVYYDGVMYENAGEDLTSYTVTSSDGDIAFSFRDETSPDTPWRNSNTVMLNTGSTAKSYEPYGYKIPILSANTTTPVYLGEVQTTRKIKKLVLTGEETGWAKNTVSESNAYYRNISDYYRYNGLCSHYVTVDSARAETGIFFGGNINFLTKLSDEIDTVDKWKSYLAQQYANGTPVTIWYVLATPTTGIVNEPLRKIGDYADTVSGISIPTITGKDTFDVLTTLKPSEVELTYTGWHDATVKEWDGSEWEGE